MKARLPTKNIAQLVAGVAGARALGGDDYQVHRVIQDSREAGPGDLFVARPGLRSDGHGFAAQAASQGAAVAVMREVQLPPNTPVILLKDSQLGLAELAAELYDRPARRLLVAGITGTDGKTTVTHLAAHLLTSGGIPAGFLSTVAADRGAGASSNSSGLSTMEPSEVQQALAEMVAGGRRVVVIEATSHALTQGRVEACEFDIAAYTHIGQDHLDYHASWEEYVEAKAGLLDLCREGWQKAGISKTGIINRRDRAYERLIKRSIPRRWIYDAEGDIGAEITAHNIDLDAASSRFTLNLGGEQLPVHLPLPARFNVANALCAAGIGLALGLSPGQIAAGLSSFPGVPGRLEQIRLGQPFSIYIDYAHSASGLSSTLADLRELTSGRLLLVFGCSARGGNHDAPGMGRAAALSANCSIITTDDPVDEDPAWIAAQIEEGAVSVGGVRGRDFEIELDRRAAIRKILSLARPGDVVLFAGKGHERSMMLANGRREPWNEREEVEAALRLLLRD